MSGATISVAVAYVCILFPDGNPELKKAGDPVFPTSKLRRMNLANLQPIGFIPMVNAKAARAFYEGTLGLEFVSDDDFALVFRSGGVMVRVVRVGEFTPAQFTVFGWETPDIEAAVDALTAKGVAFERFGGFAQDVRGIWTAPNGNKVAWFKDPDGNVLSVSNHD